MERGKVFAFQLLTDIDIGNVYLDFKKLDSFGRQVVPKYVIFLKHDSI